MLPRVLPDIDEIPESLLKYIPSTSDEQASNPIHDNDGDTSMGGTTRVSSPYRLSGGDIFCGAAALKLDDSMHPYSPPIGHGSLSIESFPTPSNDEDGNVFDVPRSLDTPRETLTFEHPLDMDSSSSDEDSKWNIHLQGVQTDGGYVLDPRERTADLLDAMALNSNPPAEPIDGSPELVIEESMLSESCLKCPTWPDAQPDEPPPYSELQHRWLLPSPDYTYPDNSLPERSTDFPMNYPPLDAGAYCPPLQTSIVNFFDAGSKDLPWWSGEIDDEQVHYNGPRMNEVALVWTMTKKPKRIKKPKTVKSVSDSGEQKRKMKFKIKSTHPPKTGADLGQKISNFVQLVNGRAGCGSTQDMMKSNPNIQTSKELPNLPKEHEPRKWARSFKQPMPSVEDGIWLCSRCERFLDDVAPDQKYKSAIARSHQVLGIWPPLHRVQDVAAKMRECRECHRLLFCHLINYFVTSDMEEEEAHFKDEIAFLEADSRGEAIDSKKSETESERDFYIWLCARCERFLDQEDPDPEDIPIIEETLNAFGLYPPLAELRSEDVPQKWTYCWRYERPGFAHAFDLLDAYE
ncbi:hypothetical protein BGZ63DRAFT_399803 [Mariannaea sp. PMI_226]|nr:hypothetical protein BGZ63DRAFT_399803 [Mariannaea sp. PMI_226]